jgi:hypothetical protein
VRADRFSERFQRVIRLADRMADRFNHEYIGTEHLLLALIQEDSGVVGRVLTQWGIDFRRVRMEVEQIVQFGLAMQFVGRKPRTPRAKLAIEYSIAEANSFGAREVDTHHLFLGLLRETEGVAAQVLMNIVPQGQWSLDELRAVILLLLGGRSKDIQPGPAPAVNRESSGATIRRAEEVDHVQAGPPPVVVEDRAPLGVEREIDVSRPAGPLRRLWGWFFGG